ncbi:MAG: gliding motility-associated C-terminal domain-containing protein [Bacteroidales bacterium]|nr:gliding motility-associated C-terminal domain-containing protein [Bacteroidales bacterium]
MKLKKIVLLITGITIGISGYTQTYTKPNEPIFDYMTIDPSTGYPTLFWTAPMHDPQYPDPTGYIIYKRIVDAVGNDGFYEIATVNQSTFTFTDNASNGNESRQHYRIASNGPTEPSRLSPQHAQIWLTSKYDSCYAKIDLSWESYLGWNNTNVNDYYRLYMSNSSNMASFQLIDSIDKFTNNYSVRNVQENQDYYFYLTARRNDKPFTTYSNMHHIRTKMATHPTFMVLDSIIATDEGTRIFYKIDPLTEIRNFKLVRWEEADSNQSIFSARIIEEFSNPNQTASIDTNDAWAARTRKYYYKVDAYNGCKTVVHTTNLCHTIIPKIRPHNQTVHLEWDELMIDSYRKPERAPNTITYTVYRRAYTENDDIAGAGQLSVAASGITETSFDDDLSPFKGQNPLYKIVFKYYIEAYERDPAQTVVTFVRSREISTEILPGLTMPTAIAPTSKISNNGRSRNIFEPIINFEATYQLTIYNRWGSVIYHGNQGWNGKDLNGKYVKEGTYIYRIVVHTNDSGDILENGSVSVVYPNE